MSPFKRLLRKIPPLRWCALQYARRERQRQHDASWAYVQSVLTTIGNITIKWAMIELFLAHLIVWHHRKHDLRPKGGLPRMLAFQLDHIKKQIERDGSLDATTAAKLGEYRRRITDLNDFRINVIHGVLHRYGRRVEWHTHALKIEGLQARIVRRTYSNAEIQAKAQEMSNLAQELSPFICRIVGIRHPENSA